MSLQLIRSVTFNPLLQTREEVSRYLDALSEGTAHPFSNGVRRYLLIKTSSGIVDIDVTEKSSSYFVDGASLGAIAELLAARIDKHRTTLGDMANYSIEPLPSSCIELPLVSGRVLCFVLSENNKPSYYDMGCGIGGTSHIDYSRRQEPRMAGIVHSGDKTHGSDLLQSISVGDSFSRAQSVAIFVSGYQGNPLHRYAAQRPCVLWVNHIDRVMYLTPVPLDQATIGESTLCCSIVMRRKGTDKVQVVVLSNPPTAEKVFACGQNFPPNAQHAMESAIARGNEIFDHQMVAGTSSTTPSFNPSCASAAIGRVGNSDSNGDDKLGDDKLVTFDGLPHIIEDGLTPLPFVRPKWFVQFGCGLRVISEPQYARETLQSPYRVSPDVVLPCCVSPLTGPMILAIGEAYTGTPGLSYQGLHKLYRSTHTLCIHVSDKMLDSARSTIAGYGDRLNGLFVVSPRSPAAVTAVSTGCLDDRERREQFMNEVSINAVTALAAPQSIVLLRCESGTGDRYFWYRGIRWPGLFDRVPAFGDEVTELMNSAQCQEFFKDPRGSSELTPPQKASPSLPTGPKAVAEWEDVEETEAGGGDAAIASPVLPWPSLVPSAQLQVWFAGALETANLDVIYGAVEALSVQALGAMKSDVMDLLTQIQSIFLSADIQSFAHRLIVLLKQKLDNTVLPLRTEYFELVSRCLALQGVSMSGTGVAAVSATSAGTGSDTEEDLAALGKQKKKFYEMMKSQTRVLTDTVRWLTDALGNLSSNRSSSSRKYDLNMMIRKNKIAGNVDAAKSMTHESLASLLEESCSEAGAVIAKVDRGALVDSLRQIRDGSLSVGLSRAMTVSWKALALQAPSVCIDGRTPYLAGCDAGLILSMTAAMQAHPLAGPSVALAIPQGFQGSALSDSSLMWPCFDEFVALRQPYSVAWINKCNDAHIAAVRILLRGTVTGATASREFSIQPQNPEVGWFLVYALVQTMQSLAMQRKTPPRALTSLTAAVQASSISPIGSAAADTGTVDESDFNDQTAQMMRGLFGQLLTLLSSGSRPLSMAWQLCSENPKIEVPEPKDRWVYLAMMNLFPFTAWPQATFHRNIAQLLVRTIRKSVVDPATEPMQRAVAALKSVSLSGQWAIVNARLSWTRLVSDSLHWLLTNDTSPDKRAEVAQRLLDKVPQIGDSMGRKGRRTFVNMQSCLSKMIERAPLSQKVREEVLQMCYSFHVQRSAALKPLKNDLVQDFSSEKVTQLEAAARKLVQDWQQPQEAIERVPGIDTIRLLQSGDGRVKLQGDAERDRIPFRVHGGCYRNDETEEQRKEYDAELADVLGVVAGQLLSPGGGGEASIGVIGGSVPAGAGAGASAGGGACGAGAVKDSTLLDDVASEPRSLSAQQASSLLSQISKLPRCDRAVRIAQMIAEDDFTFGEIHKLGTLEPVYLDALCTVCMRSSDSTERDDDDLNVQQFAEMLRELVLVMLVDWRDSVKGEEAAIRLLLQRIRSR